ncbi:delta(14)-sterol reductase LBR-like [Stegodyphus dumicola]|uniref:delta(14)-sterol reductase LBR-like n=1 Tax=Stegodyphus dumicola TaxID=202533 RepID=UPI0015A8498A|nr:delta(14)-sterol reductase LBR-like [Stegodyphus dumicola]
MFKEAHVVVSDLGSAHYRASRLAALRALETTKPVSGSNTETAKKNAVPTSEAKYSDDEEEEEEEEVTPKPKTRRSLQIVYFFGTVLRIILMPTSLLFLIFSCTKKQCTVLDTPQFYSKWRDFFNSIIIPLSSVIAFHLFQSILALIPLGRKVTGFPFDAKKITLEYRLNGFLCLIFSVLGFSIPAYLGFYMNWGYDKFKAIGLSCAIYSVLFALILHIISTVKGHGVVQSKVPVLGNFYNGVYINPVLFGKVDIKTSFIRAGLIGSALINLSILLKLFLMKGYITIPLASTAGMQIFFVFDLLFREEKLLSTATYTSDTIGYGFIMTNAFLIPIGLALQNIYLFIFEAKASTIPHWYSAAILCIFLTGYYIYLTSSNLKHNFRRNPFSSSLADVASIPTSQKKRLIASGLWGVIRHPNYLGLLIMAVAWTLPCGVYKIRILCSVYFFSASYQNN